MKLLLITTLFLSFNTFSKSAKNYKKVFANIKSVKKVKIDDPISKFKTNINFLEIYNKDKKRIGFVREVTTSTGCNDGCLPVIFTLYYSQKGELLRVISEEGLTKKNHEEFTELDYIRLESILRENPQIFKKVIHPSNMVDGITRATTKEYSSFVIKKAAYSTLRVNLYNQQTLKFIKKNYFNKNDAKMIPSE